MTIEEKRNRTHKLLKHYRLIRSACSLQQVQRAEEAEAYSESLMWFNRLMRRGDCAGERDSGWIVKGWNELIRRTGSYSCWQGMAAGGNALQRHRGRLFLAMSAEGKLKKEIPEMTWCFLEEIVIDNGLLIRLLDGSEVRVRIESTEAKTVG